MVLLSQWYTCAEVVRRSPLSLFFKLPSVMFKASFAGNGCSSVGSALPDMYARCPRARGARGRVRTYQVMHDLQCCN